MFFSFFYCKPCIQNTFKEQLPGKSGETSGKCERSSRYLLKSPTSDFTTLESAMHKSFSEKLLLGAF